ncbi:probable Bax inhibitor 1 [Lethenteron reissneri]|uniref:probable Bax inhibitor 1 n=1 Tax=Lethenteron reissneri TaxID=7753 RepID=UPI002AB6A052|nr:probable Bax inhibitor 1 [Lethenteron reissneri]
MDTLLGDRRFNARTLFDFSCLEPDTRQHLKNVYATLAICMLVASAGAYVHLYTAILQGNFLMTLVSMGLLMWLMFTPRNGQNDAKRLGILCGFAFTVGLGLGPLLDFVIAINPSIIATAFMGTSLIFGCFTLSALYARRRSYLYLGGTLMSGLSFLLMMSLFNMFYGSALLFKAQMYLGLLVMCGFVLFDTQLIVEKCRAGDKDFIWHSVDLFLDFIHIFRKLMIILTMNEKDKRKEKK